MNIEIQNILGIKDINVEISQGVPHVFSGANASGKSSVSSIIAALSATTANPLSVSVSQFKSYVHKGAAEGYAILVTDEGEEIKWLSGQGIKTLLSPLSSAESVGLVDLVNARSRASTRIQAWESVLATSDITVDILKPYFEGRSLAEYETVCQTISEGGDEGWNNALNIYVGQRRSTKQEWQKIVGGGLQYGKGLAATWTPEGWLPENERTDLLTLESELSELREVLAGEEAAFAITEKEIEDANAARHKIDGELTDNMDRISRQLQHTHDDFNEAKNKHDHLSEKHIKCRGKVSQLRLEVAQGMPTKESSAKLAILTLQKERKTLLQEIERTNTYISEEKAGKLKCPACNVAVINAGGILVKWNEQAMLDMGASLTKLDDQIKDMDINIANKMSDIAKVIERKLTTAIAKESESEENLSTQRKKLEELRSSGTKSKQERDELIGEIRALEAISVHAGSVASEGTDANTVSRIRNSISDKQKAIVDFNTWKSAKEAHNAVCAIDYIIKTLSPGGAKDEYIRARFDKIQGVVDRVTSIAEWPSIQIDAQFSVAIGGTPAAFCSESEKWRVQCALQLACGLYTKSKVIVLDRCDVLDTFGFKGLCLVISRLVKKYPDIYFIMAGTELTIEEQFDFNMTSLNNGVH